MCAKRKEGVAEGCLIARNVDVEDVIEKIH